MAQLGRALGSGLRGRKFESSRPDFNLHATLKVCKYCHLEQPDEAFEVCKIIEGKVYRRLKCQKCKRLITNRRRDRLRTWLNEYKKMLVCERCGFADFRALEFHHHALNDKHCNIGDMIGQGFSAKAIEREIRKCIVLCSNCHQIEHFEKNYHNARRPEH